MKKLLAIALVLTLVLSMSVGAFGVENNPPVYEDDVSVQVDKEVNIINDGTVNPAETFEFNIGGGEVTDGNATLAPDFDSSTFSIEVNQGEIEGFASIDLPVFTQVGVYTYPINEIAGDTAGFAYDSEIKYLRITVVNDGDGGFLRVLTLLDEELEEKIDAFENDFSAGDLKIDKVITGNYSDPNDEFEITLTVSPPEDKVIKDGPIEWNADSVSGPDDDGEYVAVYTLKGGEDVTIENLPYGVSYEVVETDSGEYEESYDSNAEGEFGAALVETTITNERNMLIDTGINLDNLPYILILVGAALGLAAFTLKRRVKDEN